MSSDYKYQPEDLDSVNHLLELYPPEVCRELVPKEVGVKHDSGKPMFHILYWPAIVELAKVATYGASKYPSPDNWKHVDNAVERYSSALMRHYTAWRGGEWLDPESKLPHLAHLLCCACYLMYHETPDEY